MKSSQRPSQHTFHVPVMGIGFTIDTPIRLAPLGIDSAISLVNDDAIEAARSYHSRLRLLSYQEIDSREPDARARRIRAYLDLVDRLVRADFQGLRQSSFDDPGGIRRYFLLLPDGAPLKERFLRAEALSGQERDEERARLRELVVPGSIGVNIMTKLDSASDEKGEPRPLHDSDAHAALRGFAESSVEGPLILSAGANPGLFAYLAEFEDFFPTEHAGPKKNIILKVSDFRSAHVQGRMLARRGLWVSEYRIESGLNCGGHAFPTEGVMMGPILQEFKERRSELSDGLMPAYQKALRTRGLVVTESPEVRVSAQGGIGTASEDRFLREHYDLQRTGWGSPFLMVPEAVLLDPRTAESLEEARAEDIQLTFSSPLGVRFWWLKSCESEMQRRARIKAGHSGSVCTARHLALRTEYGKVPLCTGSRAYQKRKKLELDPNHPDYELQLQRLEAPACICVDLCGSFLAVTRASGTTPPPAICPGPNIINFQKKERSLEEMVGHIYGRTSILTRINRPHMFIREIELYLGVVDEDLACCGTSLQNRSCEQLRTILSGLCAALEYYRDLADEFEVEERALFVAHLARLDREIRKMKLRLASRSEQLLPLSSSVA